MKRMLTFCLAMLLLCAPAHAARWETKRELPVPDFTVNCANGEVFTLSQAVAEHDLVAITLFASWCGPCRRELPLLQAALALYPGQVAVIGLSMDGTRDTDEELQKLAAELGLTFPLSRDSMRLARYLSVSEMPTLALVDREGKLLHVEKGVRDTAEDYAALFAEYLPADGVPLPEE